MEYTFGAIALAVLAIILLLAPVGIHLRGKLILLLLIMVMSFVGFMAGTFISLGQTAGLLLILTILFTYLLSKRSDSFFYESITQDTRDGEIEYKRVTLPFRIKDTIEYVPSSPEQPFTSFEDSVKTAEYEEENMEENSFIIDSHSSSHNKEEEDDQTILENKAEMNTSSVLNRPKYSTSPLQSIDQDLDTLVNRFTDEEYEDQSSQTTYEEEQKDIDSPRDLEALFSIQEIEDHDRLSTLDEDEHIINEIKLTPSKMKEDVGDDHSFSPFDLIEEIKEFKQSPPKDKD